MTAKERILRIRLLEQTKKDPEYARKLGIELPRENIPVQNKK